MREAGTPARGRKRAEEFLTRRPMTDQEQVETFIAALRRVLVDADSVAQAAIGQLVELGQRPLLEAASPVDAKPLERHNPAVVEENDFLPDEGSAAPAVTTEAMRHDVDRPALIAQILDQLLTAVRQ